MSPGWQTLRLLPLDNWKGFLPMQEKESWGGGREANCFLMVLPKKGTTRLRKTYQEGKSVRYRFVPQGFHLGLTGGGGGETYLLDFVLNS